jgi:dolichol-phosphate mannosyltransferase
MITVLVPVFEEKNNISDFVNKISTILQDFNFEILFIDDDSKDGSLEELEKLSAKYVFVNFISRKSKNRDLIESLKLGIININTDLICVTDCDLQHDVDKIPSMIRKITNENYDLIIGSRFLNKKNNIGLNLRRRINSKLGNLLSKFVGVKNVKDPLSGFFLIKTKFIKNEVKKIESKGFKILLSILYLIQDEIRIFEMDTDFFYRKEDKSKLNILVKFNFLLQLLRIYISNLKKKW